MQVVGFSSSLEADFQGCDIVSFSGKDAAAATFWADAVDQLKGLVQVDAISVHGQLVKGGVALNLQPAVAGGQDGALEHRLPKVKPAIGHEVTATAAGREPTAPAIMQVAVGAREAGWRRRRQLGRLGGRLGRSVYFNLGGRHVLRPFVELRRSFGFVLFGHVRVLPG